MFSVISTMAQVANLFQYPDTHTHALAVFYMAIVGLAPDPNVAFKVGNGSLYGPDSFPDKAECTAAGDNLMAEAQPMPVPPDSDLPDGAYFRAIGYACLDIPSSRKLPPPTP